MNRLPGNAGAATTKDTAYPGLDMAADQASRWQECQRTFFGE
jgi:hypothetical protein